MVPNSCRVSVNAMVGVLPTSAVEIPFLSEPLLHELNQHRAGRQSITINNLFIEAIKFSAAKIIKERYWVQVYESAPFSKPSIIPQPSIIGFSLTVIVAVCPFTVYAPATLPIGELISKLPEASLPVKTPFILAAALC